MISKQKTSMKFWEKTLDMLVEKDFEELRVAWSWCEESYQY